MDATPPRKEDVVLKLLEEGDTMICLDARYPGVQVPKAHSQNPNLRLILNLNFPHPIEITAGGIAANLAFGGRRFACYVPMEALWAVFNPQTMQGMMWPASMPPEVLAEMSTPQKGGNGKTARDVAAGRAQRPKVIDGNGARTAAPSHSPDPSSETKRGHLRVIK